MPFRLSKACQGVQSTVVQGVRGGCRSLGGYGQHGGNPNSFSSSVGFCLKNRLGADGSQPLNSGDSSNSLNFSALFHALMADKRKRIVVKFGSGILTKPTRDGLHVSQIRRLTAEVAELTSSGYQCVLV